MPLPQYTASAKCFLLQTFAQTLGKAKHKKQPRFCFKLPHPLPKPQAYPTTTGTTARNSVGARSNFLCDIAAQHLPATCASSAVFEQTLGEHPHKTVAPYGAIRARVSLLLILRELSRVLQRSRQPCRTTVACCVAKLQRALDCHTLRALLGSGQKRCRSFAGRRNLQCKFPRGRTVSSASLLLSRRHRRL